MSGFAVLFREAADHPLFARNSERLGAWTYLVLKVCWKPSKFNIGGKVIELQRGQICASRAQLAEAWGWSPSAVERFLTRLETEQMIERATGQGRTIITVCNYAKYQDVEVKAGQATGQATGQAPDSGRTTKEQRNQETKDIPSPNGDGRGAPDPTPLDLYKTIFRGGVDLLMAGGHGEPEARSIIGKWKKAYSEGALLAVLARCQASLPEAPVEWITKALQAEQLRAAGATAYAQGPSNERDSVGEIGREIAARKRIERQNQEQRIAIGGR